MSKVNRMFAKVWLLGMVISGAVTALATWAEGGSWATYGLAMLTVGAGTWGIWAAVMLTMPWIER